MSSTNSPIIDRTAVNKGVGGPFVGRHAYYLFTSRDRRMPVPDGATERRRRKGMKDKTGGQGGVTVGGGRGQVGGEAKESDSEDARSNKSR